MFAHEVFLQRHVWVAITLLGLCLLVSSSEVDRRQECNNLTLPSEDGIMTPKHVLGGLICDGPAFPGTIKELTASLARAIGFRPTELDYSLNSLARVESAVRCQYPPNHRSQPDLFLPIVAYISEVGRRELVGKWEMRLAEDGKTWEPWVIDAQGNEFEFFTLAYKQLCDLSDESASVVGALVGSIRARVFDHMVDKAAGGERGPFYDQLLANLAEAQRAQIVGKRGRSVSQDKKRRR